MSMQTIRVAVGSALVGLLSSAVLVAQTPNPSQATTNPSAASSPSQRDATRSPAAEAPASSATQPSDAATPHQREAMASSQQGMKTCMDRQAKATPEASKSDMTKACKEQMKAQQEHLSQAHPAPKGSSTPAPSPR
jgi:hypothetical protein